MSRCALLVFAVSVVACSSSPPLVVTTDAKMNGPLALTDHSIYWLDGPDVIEQQSGGGDIVYGYRVNAVPKDTTDASPTLVTRFHDEAFSIAATPDGTLYYDQAYNVRALAPGAGSATLLPAGEDAIRSPLVLGSRGIVLIDNSDNGWLIPTDGGTAIMLGMGNIAYGGFVTNADPTGLAVTSTGVWMRQPDGVNLFEFDRPNIVAHAVLFEQTPLELAADGDVLFVECADGSIFRVDGTTPTLLATATSPTNLVASDGTLFFVSTPAYADAEAGVQPSIWSLDENGGAPTHLADAVRVSGLVVDSDTLYWDDAVYGGGSGTLYSLAR